MVKEYKLHLLQLDNDSIVCIEYGRATMLTKAAVGYVLRLLDEIRPESKRYPLTPPARSVELAEKANGPAAGRRTHPMSQPMAAMLNTIASFKEPASTTDVINLCDLGRGTASSKLSMLFSNGYLARVDKGRYLVSPTGHAYLLEHK